MPETARYKITYLPLSSLAGLKPGDKIGVENRFVEAESADGVCRRMDDDPSLDHPLLAVSIVKARSTSVLDRPATLTVTGEMASIYLEYLRERDEAEAAGEDEDLDESREDGEDGEKASEDTQPGGESGGGESGGEPDDGEPDDGEPDDSEYESDWEMSAGLRVPPQPVEEKTAEAEAPRSGQEMVEEKPVEEKPVEENPAEQTVEETVEETGGDDDGGGDAEKRRKVGGALAEMILGLVEDIVAEREQRRLAEAAWSARAREAEEWERRFRSLRSEIAWALAAAVAAAVLLVAGHRAYHWSGLTSVLVAFGVLEISWFSLCLVRMLAKLVSALR